MAKEELIEKKGHVDEVLSDSRFRVTLENGHQVICYTGGKMRKHHIRIIAGDNVSLEMSPYDLTKGRITFRHIAGRSGPPPTPVRRRTATSGSACACRRPHSRRRPTGDGRPLSEGNR